MPTGGDAYTIERGRRALALRLAGMSYQEIADSPGMGSDVSLYADASGAHKAVARQVDNTTFGDIQKEQRAVEMDRLDALQRAMWRQALKGDVAAARIVLQVMSHRGKLLGLSNLPPTQSVEDPLDMLSARRDEKRAAGE